MSAANQCDRCGVLYAPEPRAVYFAGIGVAKRDDPYRFATWTDVELCAKCGGDVLAVLGAALDEISPEMEKHGKYKALHTFERSLLRSDDVCVCGLPAINVIHRRPE